MKKLVPLFLLVVLFITGCDLSGLTVTTTNQMPVVNSFTASPSTISGGESTTLNWTVTGATTVSIDQGIGNVALTGPRVVSPAATTIYTLTASNSAGATTATTQVIVTGAASSTPTPTPTPTPASLPVVDYFMANPPAILAGGSTTLGWSVSNATSVTIDNGVGPVSSADTAVVSPAATTNYTLTATNSAGPAGVTITVVVGAAPAAGMPDLIIEDIVRSGSSITYTIKNQGDAVAGPSTSTLLVDGATVANDSVGSLAPGEAKTETFASYTYSCTLPSDSLEVKADTGNAVVESSEANNSRAESWACIMRLVPTFVLKPDLVVEDIWLVGDTINYRIKNIGSGDAGASTSELYIYPCLSPCPPKATDSVASLAAGASRTEKFTGYNYTGAGWSVGVKVDTAGAVDESDEGNNSLSKNKADL